MGLSTGNISQTDISLAVSVDILDFTIVYSTIQAPTAEAFNLEPQSIPGLDAFH
jgi:hypothetical protein